MLPLHTDNAKARPWSRRNLLHGAGLAVLAGAAGLKINKAVAEHAAPPQVTIAIIGDANASTWTSLRAAVTGRTIDEELGTRVVWQPGFTASLPVMEAIRAGGVDFTFATATAVVNAVGARVPIVPLAAFPLPVDEVDVLVATGSPIKSAADLKGKKVAHQNGTTGTYSLIKFLQSGGLRLPDVQAVSLSGADAFTAFAQGSIDAWIHWQPASALALAKLGDKARVLPGVKTYDYAFYVAHQKLGEKHTATAARLVRSIRDTQTYINAHPDETVALWASKGGFAPNSLEQRVYRQLIVDKRLSESPAVDLAPISEAAAASTQDLADNFQALGVLPNKVDVRGFLLTPAYQSVRQAVAAELGARS
jgi:sulfonate transport system substrate-binding protein